LLSTKPYVVKGLLCDQLLDTLARVPEPIELGEGYRGEAGPIGYLLRQLVHIFNAAMENGLRDYALTSPQYGALFVLEAEPGRSAAELARAMGTTPQAANLLVVGMEQEGLIVRKAHPTHGRILEIYPTEEGQRRFRAALPFLRSLEEQMCAGFDERQVRTVKRWLIESVRGLAAVRAKRSGRD
jgi:DNA-binding MarR family transcriptional regulator